MYSHQGSFQRPNSNTNVSNNRRPVKIFGAMFAVCALAVLNTNVLSSRGNRSLSTEVRKLCKTAFNYGDWKQYWEDLFPATATYDGVGDRSLLPNEANNIGYFLTLTSCPYDGYGNDDAHDPGHAFYDAAALLKYSIFRNTYPAGSAYNATMYAFVHPSAVHCKGLNGDDYDRVKVLQDLGYHVSIIGSPVYPSLIQDPLVRDGLPDDAGERDFMKLEALTYTNHPAVVLVDFTTLMMKPIDNIYNAFLADANQKIIYSMDYSTNLPGSGSTTGPNMHFVIMKPDPYLLPILINAYTQTTYTEDAGWDNKGVKDFAGIFGVKGFLQHFYSRVDQGKNRVLGRCDYGNDNSNPYGQDKDGNTVCRDPNDCADCRAVDLNSIKVIKMIYTCGKPWECSYDDSWDSTTKAMCEGFHREWFTARMDFEESCWHDGPPSYRSGGFHPNVFLGFCTAPGILGYDRMIDDKAANRVCDRDTQSSRAVAFMPYPNGGGQNQKLTLTTGDVSGSVTACVSGGIGVPGFEPPYNLGIVIDVSGSTGGGFGGNPTGDVNGDGRSDNILDAELASIIAVMEHISQAPGLGNYNVNIGLTSFSTQATYHGQFMPLDPNNSSAVNPDLLATLLAMRSGGYTHFDDALDKAILYFEEAPKDRSNILFFLSDGIPNVPGDGDKEEPTGQYSNNQASALKFDSEIALLDGMNVTRLAIGVGSGSDIRPGYGLDMIDNTPDPVTGEGPVLVTTTDALTDELLSNPVTGTIVDFTVTVNGVEQGIHPNRVVGGPTGYTFGRFIVTGLDPHHGSMNVISTTAIMDFDGDTSTTNDQITLATTNEVPGTLI